MIQIKKILFPTDFSRCAEQAFVHALHLARQYNAELHILHAVVWGYSEIHHPVLYFPNTDVIEKEMVKLGISRMKDTVEAHDVEGIKINQVQQRGLSVAPVILDYANEKDIDLIVMGTHGRRGLGHMVLGSVAEEIVRLAPCPVLTIREYEDPRPVEALNRILVPVDFSGPAKEALCHAKEIASFYDAQLQLLHVVEQPLLPAYYMTDSIYMLNPDIDLKQRARQELEELIRDTGGPDIPVDIIVTEGRAAKEIVTFAETNEDGMIVISTHGLTGIKHMLIGSVSEKVVRMAPCPVFTVKAFGKSLV